MIVDATLSVVISGYQRWMLHKDFQRWKTEHGYFSRWNKQGLWERTLDKLKGLYRERENRNAMPSYGIIDSQSVKTIYASEERWIGGGKKVKGHIIVDLLGNLLHVPVHAAATHNTAPAIFERVAEKYTTAKVFLQGHLGDICRKSIATAASHFHQD